MTPTYIFHSGFVLETVKLTGAHFRKDGRLYNIPRNQQMQQAHRAAIDYNTNKKESPDNA